MRFVFASPEFIMTASDENIKGRDGEMSWLPELASVSVDPYPAV